MLKFKYFSARAEKAYITAEYNPEDYLVFGSETKGLGAEFLKSRHEFSYRIPIFEPGLEAMVKRNRQAGRLSFSTNVAASVHHAELPDGLSTKLGVLLILCEIRQFLRVAGNHKPLDNGAFPFV